MTEAKYQWSDRKGDEIILVRADDWTSFMLDVDKAKSAFRLEETKVTPASPAYHTEVTADGMPAIPTCGIHNVPMVKQTGPYGEFWGCPTYGKTKCKWKPLGY